MIKEKISLSRIFNFLQSLKDTHSKDFEMEKIFINNSSGSKIKCIHLQEYVRDILFGYHSLIYKEEDGSICFKFLDEENEELIAVHYESDTIHLEFFIGYLYTIFIKEIEKSLVN